MIDGKNKARRNEKSSAIQKVAVGAYCYYSVIQLI
jgi:hypothetical protein